MKVKNTETIGLWAEYLICKIRNIAFNSSRTYIRDLNYKVEGLEKSLYLITQNLDIKEHVGNNNGKYDFILQNGDGLSIKTSISNDKICPPEVGQSTLSKLQFKSNEEFKTYVLTNPEQAFNFYSNHLFKMETIYIDFKKGRVYRIPQQDFINYEKHRFSFTKDLENWKESCSMKLDKKSIAEFQVHQNRNCIKCRFLMNNLVNLIVSEKATFNPINFKVEKSIGTFNYIGSKTKLLEFIGDSIENYIKKPIKEIESFLDIFSGTGVVSSHFIKNGCNKIVTNDVMYYSYLLTSCLTTKNIDILKIQRCIDILNNLEPLDGYIFRTYGDTRMYFTKENAMLIDACRTWIETNSKNFTLEEYNLLLKTLLYASTKVANISSTYGAYLKKFKKSSTLKLKLSNVLLKDLFSSKVEVECYNKDVYDLNEINGEVCYLDPPYNSRKYSSNYFVMEAIAKYDRLEVSNGVTGIPLQEPKGSDSFCSKSKVMKSFDSLFKVLKTKYLFMSYSSESLLTKVEIIELLSKNNWKNIKVYEQEYKRFKSNSSGIQDKIVYEYLFSATC